MYADIALGRAVDAVRHLSDPAPPWKDILKSWTDLVGADGGAFLAYRGTEFLELQQIGSDAATERDYVEHFHTQDVLVGASLSARADEWIDTQHVLPVTERGRNAYYVDFMCKHRISQCVCYMIEAGPDYSAGISFHRESASDKMSSLLESAPLVTYIQALREAVAQRKAAAAQWLGSVEAAFAAFGETLCILDRAGNVVHATPAASEAMASYAGLRIRQGRLWHPIARVLQDLLAALARASDRSIAQGVLVAGNRGGSCCLDIAPADSRLRLGRTPLLVMRMRKRRPDCHALDLFCATHGMTRAEQRVLDALLDGQTVAEYASAAEVSVHTARKQVAMAMEKAGCARQVDLVRMALGAA